MNTTTPTLFSVTAVAVAAAWFRSSSNNNTTIDNNRRSSGELQLWMAHKFIRGVSGVQLGFSGASLGSPGIS